MTDDAVDRYIEQVAREEQDDLDRGLGEHVLRVAEGAEQRRREQDRALLDAIARARLAQEEGGQE